MKNEFSDFQINLAAPAIGCATLGAVAITPRAVPAFGLGRSADGALGLRGGNLRQNLLHRACDRFLRLSRDGRGCGQRRHDLHKSQSGNEDIVERLLHKRGEQLFNHLRVTIILDKCRSLTFSLKSKIKSSEGIIGAGK
jgi:hypothetical protein